MQVRLKAKNHYGKNRINQHGEWWEVTSVSITRRMMWLESLDNTMRVKPFIMSTNSRSIRLDDDQDFEIAEYRESPIVVEDDSEPSYPLLRSLLKMN